MKIGLGSDHGGFILKNQIKDYLTEKGYDVHDYGIYDGTAIDYPDVAQNVCPRVLTGEIDCAILFCGTGIGISIAANKIKGIRAAHVTDSFSSQMAMLHNNANVLCLGGRITGVEIAYTIVDAYLNASFAGGRHENRVNKIMKIEEC